MSANPIGMVVLGLTAVVGALVLAYKNSETFRNIIQGLWEKFKQLGAFIVSIPSMVVGIWDGLILKTKEIWNSINSNPFGKLALDILSLMNPITAIIRHFDKLKEGWNWIKGKVGLGEDSKTTTTTKPLGSHRTGESFVKNDGMYKLHYGERVLTKAENQQYSQGIETIKAPSCLNFSQSPFIVAIFSISPPRHLRGHVRMTLVRHQHYILHIFSYIHIFTCIYRGIG